MSSAKNLVVFWSKFFLRIKCQTIWRIYQYQIKIFFYENKFHQTKNHILYIKYISNEKNNFSI